MDIFSIERLILQHERSGEPYHEFLRAESLSAGIYGLPASGEDPQKPHAEDEIYLVIQGEARIRVGDEDAEVAPGSFVFVPAGVPHSFYAIQSDLKLLVLFAPAETTAP